MTVKLTGNFLATARCLIFEDGNGITWEFDPTTNELTANASGSSANTAANLSGGLAGDIPYQTGVGATTFLAPGSNGNLLTLSGGLPVWEAVPTWNQNTTGNAATATNVPYSGLTGSVPTWNQNTSGTAAGLSTTLAIGSGGTGQTTAITAFEALSPMTTTGDIIYAPGAGTATRLGIGTNGQVLTVGGGIPGWSTPAAVPSAANPTGTVGLATVNGSATTFMRSDGAPLLSQAISPIWTGNHIFAPTSGVALLVKANGGASAFEVTGNITSPTVEAYGPTAAALVDMTPDSGTFTVTATGMTTSPTGTATWSRIGKIVLLYLPLVTGTSNANTFTFTGLPAAIQPATLTQQIAAPTDTFEDATALLTFNASILITAGSGTITFLKNGSTTSWTTSGTKGLDATITFAYLLN